MSLIVELFGLLALFVFGPILVLSAMVAEFALSVRRVFHFPTLAFSASCFGFAAMTFDHMTTEASNAPFKGAVVSLTESVAQSHVIGIPVPYALFIAGVLLLTFSVVIRLRSPVAD